jgi:hypothetical protein
MLIHAAQVIPTDVHAHLSCLVQAVLWALEEKNSGAHFEEIILGTVA